MKKVLRVGLVGCGGNSTNHLNAWAASRGAEVVALCDVEPARSQSQAERFGIPRVYRDFADLCAQGLDVIDIVTPVKNHCAMAVDALEAGHHVIVEKPMASSSVECERMILAAKDHDRTLSVVHNKRFFESVRRTKRALTQERLRVARMRYSHFQAGLPPRDWQLTRQNGIWWDTLIHLVYVTMHLMGPIEAVCARGRSIQYPVLDSLSVLCRTTGGFSYCEYDRNTAEHVQSFQVLTEDGTRFDGEMMPDYVVRRARPYASPFASARRMFTDDLVQPWNRWRPILHNLLRHGFRWSSLPFENTFRTYIGETVDFLQGRTQAPPVPAEEGLQAIRVLEAVDKALGCDRWIEIPVC